MAKEYSALPSTLLEQGVPFYRPESAVLELPTMDDPAVVVMTDLKKVKAVTIRPAETIEAAELKMRQRGVRMLLVVDDRGAVVGLITATDLMGERPMQCVERTGGAWGEVLVRDVMTPQAKLQVLRMDDVGRARVGDIVATLKKAGRQHALVMECDPVVPHKEQVLRGIFSSTQIARQTGLEIQTAEIASTFAEIEMALASS